MRCNTYAYVASSYEYDPYSYVCCTHALCSVMKTRSNACAYVTSSYEYVTSSYCYICILYTYPVSHHHMNMSHHHMNMSHHHMIFLDIELRCNTLCALAGESKGGGCWCDRCRAERHCHSAHQVTSRTRQEVFIYTYICIY